MIKDEAGFVMVFVLIVLLLTGILTTSLLRNSVLTTKIIDNYIMRKKTKLLAKGGLLIVKKLKEENINSNYPLDLYLDRDYNIKISIEKMESEDYINYKVIGCYLTNSKEIFHSYPKDKKN